jgi:hypothetical protein
VRRRTGGRGFRARRTSLAWGDLLALAGLLVPVVLLVRRSFAAGPWCAVLGGGLDARLVNYLLEWGYQHLYGGAAPELGLWSPPFFYPAEQILAYSENLIAGYPLYFPLRWAGLSPSSAFFGFHLLQLALTPVVAYLCLRWLRLDRWAAFVGAALFAWSWVRFMHYGHVQFSAGYPIPLFFTALYAAAWRRLPWAWALAAWTFLYTWYFSLYTAVFLLLGATFVACAALLLPGGWRQFRYLTRSYLRFSRRHPRQAAAILLICLAAVALVLPGAVVYHGVYEQFGPAAEEEIRIYWGDPTTWVRPPPGHPFLAGLREVFPEIRGGGQWEKMKFLGWLALVGLALPSLGLVLWGRRTYRLWPRSLVAVSTSAGALLVVFSAYGGLWVEIPFWFLHEHFPGLGGLRAPSRIAFVVSWFVVLCLANELQLLSRRLRRGGVWAGVVGLLLLGEGIAPLPPVSNRCIQEDVWERTAQHLCRQVPREQVGTLLFLPMDIHSIHNIVQNSLAMQVSLRCDLNVVNGYSGRQPKLIAPLLGAPRAEFPCPSARKLVERIHRRSGRGILVHLDQRGPMGPAGYPVTAVESCLAPCLAAPPAWYVPQAGRPAEVFVTDPGKACAPPRPGQGPARAAGGPGGAPAAGPD